MCGVETSRYADLFKHGVAVRDAFLPRSLVEELLACARRRHALGEFGEAHIGADTRTRRRADIRGDSTCWLGEPFEPAERTLADTLERLRLDLNRESYLGLFDVEAHYARYPAGAGYARHVDQLMDREQRQISLVLYLNSEWRAADGGELRLFDAAGGHVDVEPLGGRLVCFMTAGREHEVLPTHIERWSITAWLRRRQIRG